MSRIGNKHIQIPEKVKVDLQGQKVLVEGPKGKLEFNMNPRAKVEVKDNTVVVSRHTNIRTDRAVHGLTRSIINNMILGVTEGFKKELEIEGVGYKAQVNGKVLNLALGQTHPINYNIPEGIEIKAVKPTHLAISGMDKQRVGQVAAEIRGYHEPEPYKGKGIRYLGEQVRRKQGKTVG